MAERIGWGERNCEYWLNMGYRRRIQQFVEHARISAQPEELGRDERQAHHKRRLQNYQLQDARPILYRVHFWPDETINIVLEGEAVHLVASSAWSKEIDQRR